MSSISAAGHVHSDACTSSISVDNGHIGQDFLIKTSFLYVTFLLINVHLLYNATLLIVITDVLKPVIGYKKHISKIIVKSFLHVKHHYILNQGNSTLL